MSRSTATAHHNTLLRQEIHEDGPGSILRDFQMLLGYVAEKAPLLTKTGLLPMQALAQLNARLSRPIQIDLQRPKQKSFPHINGLFLLLRTSGIAQARPEGKGRRLTLDAHLNAQWQGLTDTERYLTLIEIWLLEAELRLIGERDRRSNLSVCLALWHRLGDGTRREFPSMAEQEHWLSYSPGYLNLAMMELFGWARVDHGVPAPRNGWRVRAVEVTPLGSAFLSLLAEDIEIWLPSRSEDEDETTDGEGGMRNRLYRLLGEVFPAWKQFLDYPAWPFQPGVYRMEVALNAGLWRRFEVPGNALWEELADAILDAFGFDHDHLYVFGYTLPTGKQLDVRSYRPLFCR